MSSLNFKILDIARLPISVQLRLVRHSKVLFLETLMILSLKKSMKEGASQGPKGKFFFLSMNYYKIS